MVKKATVRQARYDKDHTIFIGLKLNLETDKDIIEAIDMSNRQGSIKALIRKALQK